MAGLKVRARIQDQSARPPVDLCNDDVPTAADLIGVLRVRGYAEGFPSSMSKRAVAADVFLCKSLECPGCGGEGMECRPLHRGGSYRVVASCKTCGAGEEV